MKLRLIALCLLVLSAACRPAARAPAWITYRDEPTGFSIRHPEGWTRAEGSGDLEDTVHFVPPGDPSQGAEFIAVFTAATGVPPTEFEIRRVVFRVLPVHGVSGFQQDPRTTDQTLWYRFEVTGSTGTTEWASVGAAAAGRKRMQVAVCAKPLRVWREGQKQCDEVVRSFVPGELNGR